MFTLNKLLKRIKTVEVKGLQKRFTKKIKYSGIIKGAKEDKEDLLKALRKLGAL